ncbi:nodulation protein NodZ [Nodularia sp. UHCC 0506]|uniref:nodulation protein NodZ n=1 Tax=Nodularia sp. UHCC 0506 TaxID=3110243 RepID=UPI002B21BD43|nr:nodulation protein NodZ [Nodularia sp. UHCC 0506]MEA5516907.1 nodulation protein NodZ [Nodularia sp. UHCC 0506]
MNYYIQEANSLEADFKDRGIIIILGWYFGLGALIQSTVNSIWLAKKLGKTPYIWWGHSCLYTDKALGGNTYSRLFQAPEDHVLPTLAGRTSIYPKVWEPIASGKTIDVEILDAQASALASCQNLHLTSYEHDDIVASDLCIIYQYLSSDLARSIASAQGIIISEDQYIKECNDIFAYYFQPQPKIKASADAIWKEIFGNQKSVIGMHCRGTDKVIEKAIPSPRDYLRTIQKLIKINKSDYFFIATDSQVYLERLKHELCKLGTVGVQDIVRSQGRSALHFKPNGAFENGVAMVIDIELLCRCKVVFAFPGSQIFWWLSRKRDGEKLDFNLISVQPSIIEWVHPAFAVLRIQGWLGLINFLRIQKSRMLSFFKAKFF